MHTLSHTFDLPLRPNQIYDFRGAFIANAAESGLVSDEDITLLANRNYKNKKWGIALDKYPLIQYRVDQGMAQVCALQDGVKTIQALIKNGVLGEFTIQNNHLPLKVVNTVNQKLPITIKEEMETYLLFHYIPYDQNDDHEYHKQENMKDRISILEQSIMNGIFYSLKSLEVVNVDKPKVEIIDIITKDKAIYKTKDDDGEIIKNKIVSYFMKIRCNVENLDMLAIGKHKAYGYGVVRSMI